MIVQCCNPVDDQNLLHQYFMVLSKFAILEYLPGDFSKSLFHGFQTNTFVRAMNFHLGSSALC